MTIRDLLQRFRPAGTPGPAARAAVPADRAAATAYELARVFALLAAAQAEAERIRAGAVELARHRCESAARQSERLVLDARARAETVRAEAYASARARAEADGAALLAEAEADAGRVRRRVEERLPEYARRAVDTLLATLLEEPDGAGCGREGADARRGQGGGEGGSAPPACGTVGAAVH